MMRPLIACLIALATLVPVLFAENDCARVCCKGTWDNVYDTCYHPQGGYDSCVSQCEGPSSAANTGSGSNCCVPAAMLLVVAGGVISRR